MTKTLRTVLVALAALCVCAVASGEGQTTDLVVWGMQLGPNDQGMDAVIRRFEESHPGVTVHMLGMGAGRMNPQKLMTAIVGGVPPDIVLQDRFSVPDWAHLGAFEPLDDLISRDEGKDANTPTAEQYYPAPWSECHYEGHQYGIPWMADTRILYWNRAVFRQKANDLRKAGLDPDRAPRTWSELLAYSKVLTEFNPDGTLKRAGFMPNFGNSWLYLYAFQNEASFMSPDGKTCTLNTPASREALQFMYDGYQICGGYANAEKFRASLRGNESDPFFTGQVAMKIDGDWIMPGFILYAPKLDFGVAPPPIPDDRYYKRGRFKDVKDRYITWTGGFCWAIPKGARHRDLAWEFIKHVTSTKMRMLEMSTFAGIERERGRPYVPRPTAQIETNKEEIAAFMPKTGNMRAASQLHIAMMPVARFRPSTFAGQRLWDEHVRATDMALLNVMSINDALQSGQDRVQDYLDEVNNRDSLPVADLTIPSVVGGAGFLLGVVLLIGWYKRQRLGKLARHEAKWGLIFVAPWVFGFVVLTLGPMLASLYLSFTQYNIFDAPHWTGMTNYTTMFGKDRELITKSFMNVLYLGGVGVPLGLVTGLATAMLLNAGVRGLRYYRTLFYLPNVVPGIASIILWLWILNADPSRGMMNWVWQHTLTQWFGTLPPAWIASEAWAKPALITMGLWGAAGGMILWLAGLKGIPNQLYEAASIDGASAIQQFWSITVPQLSPLIFFQTIIGGIGVLQTFDNVYVALNGQGTGPNDSLLVPVYYLFQHAFYYFKLGYASAIAWMIFLIALVVTGLQFLVAKKWVHYEVDS
ncbi:MAG TPA: extracellular solute-binding protein [Fimbriimonadaceae bacterium]|nr:extracellular solute-binding protein [Fimbriimonadaceae bacterium]